MENKENSSVDTRLLHVEKDVQTLQTNEKELFKEISSIREGQIETKIYVRLINESQALMTKTSKENQDEMLKIIQDIKDAPSKNWKQTSMTVKAAVYVFIITYTLGFIGTCIMGIFKYMSANPV